MAVLLGHGGLRKLNSLGDLALVSGIVVKMCRKAALNSKTAPYVDALGSLPLAFENHKAGSETLQVLRVRIFFQVDTKQLLQVICIHVMVVASLLEVFEVAFCSFRGALHAEYIALLRAVV